MGIKAAWVRFREARVQPWRKQRQKLKRSQDHWQSEIGATAESLPVEERLPSVDRETLKLEIAVGLDSLSLYFWPTPGETTPSDKPCAEVKLGPVNVSARIFTSMIV